MLRPSILSLRRAASSPGSSTYCSRPPGLAPRAPASLRSRRARDSVISGRAPTDAHRARDGLRVALALFREEATRAAGNGEDEVAELGVARNDVGGDAVALQSFTRDWPHGRDHDFVVERAAHRRGHADVT